MPTNDALKQALEIYRVKEKKLLEDLQSVRFTIRQMELDLGEVPSSSEIPVNIGDSLPPMTERIQVTNGRKPEIRPDEFFGMTQAEAARKYLKRIGHAISFEELVSALQAGGCKVGGDNPKRVLYISLVRNTRDFVPPQQGYIGLREFYPGVVGRPQKERVEKTSKKRGRPPKARSTGKRRGRPSKKTVASKTDSEKKPSELVGAVRSILSDKQPHSVDEILTAVAAKLGRPVKKIGVLGTLRNQNFEKVDGKYRLVK